VGQELSITVDRTVCMGTAMCVGTAPDRFTLVDGKSSAVADRTPFDDDVLAAAETCPVEAITVRDAATGEVIAPAD
jgi:ferredoxin